jgi:dTDP-4-amino-4,6-dideoxygalactose transaminase
VKLPYLTSCIRARTKAAAEYNAGLKPLTDLLEIPYCIPQSTHVYHQYTVKIKQNRADLQKYLKEKGIPTMVYYPLPVHHQPAFKDIVKIAGTLSESEKLCQSVLSLPMHTELEEKQIQYIIYQLSNYE